MLRSDFTTVAGTSTRPGVCPVIPNAIAAMICASLAAVAPHAHAQCTPEFFEGRGFPGTNGPVYASIEWDSDGPGGQPALPVIGGSFNIAGEVFANNIATWNGSAWVALGDGIPGTNTTVRTFAIFDDGNGPDLYAGGFFNTAGGAPANYIARWNGTSWAPVSTGMDGRVETLAVFDDGDGPALYAGGAFLNAGGQSAHFIARWNGKDWSSVGTGMDSWVLALTVFDDGGGPSLYAGGQFIIAGGLLAPFAARWDGQTWSDLDTGEVDGVIHALTTYDDGGGSDLYAAGEFTFIGTLAVANFVARWNGTAWSSLDAGANDTIYRLAVFDDGGALGPALYAGGLFTSAGIVSANHVAAWDGAAWSSLGGGVNNTVTALAVVGSNAEEDEGSDQASLYVGGLFHGTEDMAARHIARWDGAAWTTLGTGAGMNAAVNAMTAFDDGGGEALYAAGGFTTAGSALASNVARWAVNGNAPELTWAPLDAGTNFLCHALAIFDDALFAGGWFTTAGGAPASYVAQWDGQEWSALGDGVSYIVRALTVFDDGNDPALYAGGAFQSAGGARAGFIARWDGAQWTPLSTGMNNYVYALAVFDDGTPGGPALYAGGEFTMAGGQPANFIAKWDGSAWSSLGMGLNSAVYALAVFDDGAPGAGPALYAGGFFDAAGGATANCVARWDGDSWSAVGTGMAGGAFPAVLALATFDDGNGPALYAGGQFTTADGAPANRIARWPATREGHGWEPLSTGLQGTSAPAVHALTVFDDGTGPSLYMGGAFDIAGGLVSAYWARWGCGGGNCAGDLNDDGNVDALDFLMLIAQWGSPCTGTCEADITGPRGAPDGNVDSLDFLRLIGEWGSPGECPKAG